MKRCPLCNVTPVGIARHLRQIHGMDEFEAIELLFDLIPEQSDDLNYAIHDTGDNDKIPVKFTYTGYFIPLRKRRNKPESKTAP